MPESFSSSRPPKKGRTRSNSRAHLVISWDWVTRPAFGLLLAGAAIAATVKGGYAFALFLLVGAAAAAREWHRLFAPESFAIPVVVTVIAIACALAAQIFALHVNFLPRGLVPFAVLAFGCIVNFGGTWRAQAKAAAHGGGVLYIGLAAVSLQMLRSAGAHPLWLVLILFIAIWATDTGALITGSLIGGPKLAPRLSPNKTWAGFIGGVACAVIASCMLAALLSSGLARAAIFAAIIAVAAHLGDLFESLMKRRSGRKDSGGLIPGHGGVLDRIDSALFAAPVAAVLVLGFGFDPLVGMAA